MDFAAEDRRVLGITGNWSTTALDPGACTTAYAKEVAGLWPHG